MNAPNPEQAAAIEAPGVVFVSAGAGTGKTTVLVERFVKAVCGGVDVDSLLGPGVAAERLEHEAALVAVNGRLQQDDAVELGRQALRH